MYCVFNFIVVNFLKSYDVHTIEFSIHIFHIGVGVMDNKLNRIKRFEAIN